MSTLPHLGHRQSPPSAPQQRRLSSHTQNTSARMQPRIPTTYSTNSLITPSHPRAAPPLSSTTRRYHNRVPTPFLSTSAQDTPHPARLRPPFRRLDGPFTTSPQESDGRPSTSSRWQEEGQRVSSCGTVLVTNSSPLQPSRLPRLRAGAPTKSSAARALHSSSPASTPSPPMRPRHLPRSATASPTPSWIPSRPHTTHILRRPVKPRRREDESLISTSHTLVEQHLHAGSSGLRASSQPLDDKLLPPRPLLTLVTDLSPNKDGRSLVDAAEEPLEFPALTPRSSSLPDALIAIPPATTSQASRHDTPMQSPVEDVASEDLLTDTKQMNEEQAEKLPQAAFPPRSASLHRLVNPDGELPEQETTETNTSLEFRRLSRRHSPSPHSFSQPRPRSWSIRSRPTSMAASLSTAQSDPSVQHMRTATRVPIAEAKVREIQLIGPREPLETIPSESTPTSGALPLLPSPEPSGTEAVAASEKEREGERPSRAGHAAETSARVARKRSQSRSRRVVDGLHHIIKSSRPSRAKASNLRPPQPPSAPTSAATATLAAPEPAPPSGERLLRALTTEARRERSERKRAEILKYAKTLTEGLINAKEARGEAEEAAAAAFRADLHATHAELAVQTMESCMWRWGRLAVKKGAFRRTYRHAGTETGDDLIFE